MRQWLLFVGILLSGWLSLQGQFYTDFGLQVRQESVYLSWTLPPGNTCQGTFIERSNDGVRFDTIGVIAGVCGDPFVAMSFDFVDTLPLINQPSWYRLAFGNVGFSEPLPATVIRFRDNGIQILRNADGSQVQLHYANPANQLFTLRIYVLSGQCIWQTTTRSNVISIPPNLSGQPILYELLEEGIRYASGWLR